MLNINRLIAIKKQLFHVSLLGSSRLKAPQPWEGDWGESMTHHWEMLAEGKEASLDGHGKHAVPLSRALC